MPQCTLCVNQSSEQISFFNREMPSYSETYKIKILQIHQSSPHFLQSDAGELSGRFKVHLW